MKKLLCFLFLLLVLPITAIAEEVSQQTVQQITTPQNISFETCTRIFQTNKEKLFYLTLASLSANRFTIKEIQTENGYVIFNVNKRRYLATVAGIDNKSSMLKITPCDNVYFFPYGIISNTFKYIDLNINTTIN